LTGYNDGMSETHERGYRRPAARFIGAAVGAALVLFGALWIASPFLLFGGHGSGEQIGKRYLTPVPYLGLFPIAIGSIVIWVALFDRRSGDERRLILGQDGSMIEKPEPTGHKQVSGCRTGCLCGILGALLGIWAGYASDVAAAARMSAAGETVDFLPVGPIVGLVVGGTVGMLFGTIVAVILSPPRRQ
jgi:hypothetical protein